MTGLMQRRRRGAGMVLLAAAFVFASHVAALAEGVTVSIDNFTFKPDVLTIKRGSTVTFVNHDDIPHSIVDAGKAFRSKVLDTNESFTFTFDTAGDISYFCGLHPHMTGHIVVTP